jgi:prophage tail gpP-like protein
VIKHIGADISVIDLANPALFKAAEDVAAPEPGQKAFDFIEALARKRHVLLTSNGDGDVVITQSSGTTSAGVLQNILDADDNNVIAASMSYDQTGRYNVYKFASALNPIAIVNAGNTNSADVVKQDGSATDPDIRTGRQLILVSEGPFSNSQNKDRAKWEANIRRARGRVYSATVQGFRIAGDSGDLWGINTLVPVRDDFAGVEAQMLVNSVTFSFDAQNGRQTVVSLVDKNAYSLQLSEPKTETISLGLS